jgi:hypothetical protein
MEHLLRPRSPITPLEHIPYYSIQPYDGNGFLLYPLRTKWVDEHDNISDEAFQRSEEDISQFIQAYLWFGLGHEVLGDDFNAENFVCKMHSGDEVLTTIKLPELAKRWSQVQRRQTRKARKERFEHLHLCLQRSQQMLVIFDHEESQAKIDGRVERAVAALGEFLSCLVVNVLLDQEMQNQVDVNWWSKGPATFYRKLFENSRWCVSEWDRLISQTKSIAGISYYTDLDAPMADKCHKTCTVDLCHTYQIDKSVYKTKHATLDCRCQKIHADRKRVEHFLSNDSFPILRFDDDIVDTRDGPLLRAESWESGKPYVAISHVWADGMGNPNNNELPACQLRRIQKLVDNLPVDKSTKKPSILPGRLQCYDKQHEIGQNLNDWLGHTGRDNTKAQAEYAAIVVKNFVRKHVGLEDEDLPLAAGNLMLDFWKTCKYGRSSMTELVKEIIDIIINFEGFPSSDWSPVKLVKEIVQTMDISTLSTFAETPHVMECLRAIKGILLMAQTIVSHVGLSSGFGYDLVKAIMLISEIARFGMSSASSSVEREFQGGEWIERPCACVLKQVDHSTRDQEPEKQRCNAFWIDTMCCPVVPDIQESDSPIRRERQRKRLELKNKSLAKLKQVYEEATHVLVIDSYLEAVKSEDLMDLEILMRIFASGWTRRLWTLQEGALAKQLWFQFADSAVNFKALYRRWALSDIDPQECMFQATIENQIESIARFRLKIGVPGRSYAQVLVNALRCRSVSVPSDEPLAIANLLDVDLSKIILTQAKPEMKHLWDEMNTVPTELVFSRGSRIQEPGYRWAPSTFLGIKAELFHEQHTEHKPGKRTPKGLRVELRGFEFVGGKSVLPIDIFKRNHHFHFYLRGEDEQEIQWYCCKIDGGDDFFEQLHDEDSSYNLIALAFANEPTRIDNFVSPKDIKIRRPMAHTPALFCSVDRSKFYSEHEAHARSLYVVNISPMQNYHKYLPDPSWNDMVREVDAIMKTEVDIGLEDPYGIEDDIEKYRQRRRQVVADIVKGNLGWSQAPLVAGQINEYYELWGESGFGVEVIPMNGHDRGNVTWLID